ncbi:hypothetical protein AVEN_119605-1 [Araneus ventricosus]|uniref:Uncharacterized protein n=1 Tax=Araneus ventricosus TaxID=182803 RepID=A0A4Y2LE59_ARAVE|nr:hypothetical protein AVEN_262821-1 [Araneus ventricosus]GBN12194.1 hypothetical protein AVEN_48108-1 [Araneus ventricosus]GBN12199.1 hypothetical protein AVEN_51647-1 [Araneus ventricosus]GBN12213.1 hypothetical protein AVEN_119605-1 [Araneus ventricosus]
MAEDQESNEGYEFYSLPVLLISIIQKPVVNVYFSNELLYGIRMTFGVFLVFLQAKHKRRPISSERKAMYPHIGAESSLLLQVLSRFSNLALTDTHLIWYT